MFSLLPLCSAILCIWTEFFKIQYWAILGRYSAKYDWCFPTEWKISIWLSEIGLDERCKAIIRTIIFPFCQRYNVKRIAIG